MKRKNLFRKRKYHAGVTLLELLVALIIVGILASVAVPSYVSYVSRNKLAEAVSTLHDLRLRMEQYYQDNRTYLKGSTCAVTLPTLDEFAITCGNAARRTFTFTAKNKANVGLGAAGDYEYTINQDGAMATVKYEGKSVSESCLRVGPSC